MKDRPALQESAHAIVQLFGEPAPPGPKEVARVLEACGRLARGRLLAGPTLTPLHPRYRRDSLVVSFPGGLSLAQESIRRFSETLGHVLARAWWFGVSEYFELAPRDGCTADFAGWLRSRAPVDPRSKPAPPPADPEPARRPPDFVAHWLLDGAASPAQQRRASLYQRAGIPWYWTLDLANGVLRVLALVNGEYRVECIAGARRRVTFPPFESVELDLERLFFPQTR